MPKEIVLSPREFFETPGEAGPEIEGLIQISWSHDDGYIQVATFSRGAVTKETIWDGFYTDLDRRGINQLIKHLRHARDQACGKDE